MLVVGGSNPSTLTISREVLEPLQRELLRNITLSVGELAIRVLSGVERGSIMTLSMTVDALLIAEADSVTFLSVRDKFVDLATDSTELKTLYGALLCVCELAVLYDEDMAQEIGAALLSLSASSTSFLN